jgi:hypothetical protein
VRQQHDVSATSGLIVTVVSTTPTRGVDDEEDYS